MGPCDNISIEPDHTYCVLRNSDPNKTVSNSWQYNTTPATPPPPHNQNVSHSIDVFTQATIALGGVILLCVVIMFTTKMIVMPLLMHNGTRVKEK